MKKTKKNAVNNTAKNAKYGQDRQRKTSVQSKAKVADAEYTENELEEDGTETAGSVSDVESVSDGEDVSVERPENEKLDENSDNSEEYEGSEDDMDASDRDKLRTKDSDSDDSDSDAYASDNSDSDHDKNDEEDEEDEEDEADEEDEEDEADEDKRIRKNRKSKRRSKKNQRRRKAEEQEDDEDSDEDENDEDSDEEDSDEDGDEDEDEDEDEEELTEEELTKEEKRKIRHNRRIRNQVIAYLVLIVILAGAFYGGYVGVRTLIHRFSATYKAVPVTISEDAATEDGENGLEEGGIIATPDSISDDTISEDSISEDAAVAYAPEVQAVLDSMTLEQKIANLFIVTPESITGVTTATRAGDGTKAALEQYAVGGIIYSSANVTGADQFSEMVQTTKSMYNELYGHDLWTVVQEEGAVNTIAGGASGITAESSAASIGATGDAGNAYTAYSNIGNYLYNYGINMNLCPVCDVKISESCYLGERSFGTDASVVSEMVKQAVDAELENAVTPCLTAFPGQGDVTTSPVDGAISTERTLDDMRACEFLPFQAGIEEGAQVVLVSHLIAANATGETVPSSLSSVMINDELRGELGFNGVVVTDRMDDAAITSSYSAGEAAVMAIQAGADVILCPADFTASYQALLDAVNNGTISEDRINESLNRIYTVKLGL